MSRAVPEWIGDTPDTAIPDRVRVRVFLANARTCQCGCGMKIRTGDPWDTDHTIALINGGENRESNLRTVLRGPEHHGKKSKADVAEKSATYRLVRSHYGLKKPKGRAMLGTKASGVRKRMSGRVERWE